MRAWPGYISVGGPGPPDGRLLPAGQAGEALPALLLAGEGDHWPGCSGDGWRLWYWPPDVSQICSARSHSGHLGHQQGRPLYSTSYLQPS